jgi:hypothetical protein
LSMVADAKKVLRTSLSNLISPKNAQTASSHHDISTALQTPSTLQRLRQDRICKCGSTAFVEFRGRLNCKQCGVFVIQTQESFIFVSYCQ